MVDLGGSYEIKEMAALFGDGFATDYEFVGYVENEGWQTLYTGSNGAENTRVSYELETPKVLRYAAIKALKPDGPLQTGGQMFVKEFEVIRVMPEVAPASIRLNANAMQLVKNEEASLTAEVLPPQATNKNVIWSTSDPAVAQVDTMGKVTGVGVGTATITATTESGALTDHLAVTVVKTDPSGNLALFKPAYVYDVPGGTILGTHENRGPGKAVDRLTTTATQADGSYAWTYVVDLEQQVDVGKIAVKFAEGFASEFHILGSVNGVAWETLALKTASQYGETVIHDPHTAKSLRYVAIQAIKPDGPSQTGGQMILAELEVYAGVRTNNPPATDSPATSETPAKSTPPSEHKEEQEQQTEPSLPYASFTDTEGHWASEYIRAAVKHGIALGYPDETFRPNERTTRAMVATMLNRLLKLAAKSEWNASDSGKVPDWAKTHMQALWENGIMTGYKDGTLRANEPITRTELIAIIVRALKLKLPDEAELPFADAMQIPKWAKPYIAAAYDAGLVSGVGGNRFAPNEFATSAEVVKLLYLLDLQQ